MAYKKTVRRTVKRTYKRKSVKRAVRRPAMKKLIRKEIQRTAETKTISVVNLDTGVYPSSYASFDSKIIGLGPMTGGVGIYQGTAQDQRVGNRITIKRCTIKGNLMPNPYNVTTNTQPMPLNICMYLFWDKKEPCEYPTPKGNTDFFQFGSTFANFQNDLVDTWSPINTDRYHIVARKTFKVGYAAYEGTGINAGAQAYQNNDYKYNRTFSIDLTKHMIKNVRFNDNTGDPSTRGLFMMLQAIGADGSQINSSQIPAHVDYVMECKYTDV